MKSMMNSSKQRLVTNEKTRKVNEKKEEREMDNMTSIKKHTANNEVLRFDKLSSLVNMADAYRKSSNETFVIDDTTVSLVQEEFLPFYSTVTVLFPDSIFNFDELDESFEALARIYMNRSKGVQDINVYRNDVMTMIITTAHMMEGVDWVGQENKKALIEMVKGFDDGSDEVLNFDACGCLLHMAVAYNETTKKIFHISNEMMLHVLTEFPVFINTVAYFFSDISKYIFDKREINAAQKALEKNFKILSDHVWNEDDFIYNTILLITTTAHIIGMIDEIRLMEAYGLYRFSHAKCNNSKKLGELNQMCERIQGLKLSFTYGDRACG